MKPGHGETRLLFEGAGVDRGLMRNPTGLFQFLTQLQYVVL